MGKTIDLFEKIRDTKATFHAKNCTVKYLGADAFTEMPESSMSSEDFAFYLQKYDGVFCHLGTGDKTANLHTDKFDFDDEVLERGIRFFVGLALDFQGDK